MEPAAADPRIHPLAGAFDGAADAYERGRPDYPADAVAAIASRLGLRPGRIVLDLGAGTGKLTRGLTPSGAEVIAVEPVGGMRARLREAVPGVRVLDGTAEAIPLANASVDGAVVGQAFHWFDAPRALSDPHRVVRPDGHLVLAYNLRDETVPWVRRLGEILDARTDGEAPSTHHGWRERLALSGLFEPVEIVSLRHVQLLDVEGVLDRARSVSTVAALPPAEQAALLAEVRELLATDPDTAGRDRVELPYDTELTILRRATIEPGTSGVVVAVNRNEGGVPKRPVDGAHVGTLGLDGDGHHHAIHGGELAAVCLYAQEAIERVRADGHQAFPGAFGENLTLLGIDWAGRQAGDRLELGEAGGDGPLLELVKPTTPCATQAAWFVGGRYGRINHTAHPEDARWYARVLREGPVAPGTPVRLLPAG